MRLLKSIFLFATSAALLLQSVSVIGQIASQPDRTQISKPKPEPPETPKPDKKVVSIAEKRAYELLIATIAQSSQIEDVVDRSKIIASASVLLWKSDERRSRTALAADLDALFDEYQKQNSHDGFDKIESEIKSIASQVSSCDTKLSIGVITRLNDMKRQMRKNGQTLIEVSERDLLDDKAILAVDILSTNPKEAVTMGSQILESGIPDSFPNLLYSIADRDKAQADDLFRQALQVMKTQSMYSWSDELNLSAYAFKDKLLIRPGMMPGEHYPIHLFTRSDPPVDPTIANEFLTVSLAKFTEGVLNNFGNVGPRDYFLHGYYYLADKFAFYAAVYDRPSVDSWLHLETRIESMINNDGADPESYKFRPDYAKWFSPDREKIEGIVNACFEEAARTADKALREYYLILGILELIWDGKYSEAEQAFKKLDRKSTVDQINDYLCMRAGESAVDQSNWTEASRRESLIGNKQARALLLLKTAAAIIKSGKKPRTPVTEILNDAVRLIYREDTSSTKTSLSIAAAGLFYKAGDRTGGTQVLQSSIHDINSDPHFGLEHWNVSFQIGDERKMASSMDDWDLNVTISEAAVSDWDGTMLLISGIESTKLRLTAQIAAARGILSH